MDRDNENEQHESVLMGVCLELAQRMDVHPALVRVNVLLSGLLLAPLVAPAYVLTGLLLTRRSLAC
jgi:phage shock protein PspC (stress-responsive transcriptional regulator)